MHAHVAGVRKNSYNQNFSETTLEMLLDYGVTTIRNPGGPTNESVALKHNVSEGNIEGPEIFTAGSLLNGPQIAIPFVEKQISTEEETREEVQYQGSSGGGLYQTICWFTAQFGKSRYRRSFIAEE